MEPAIAALLSAQLDPRSSNEQRAACLQQLRAIQAQPGFIQALAALPAAPSANEAVTVQALILLKNLVSQGKFPEDQIQSAVMHHIPPLLAHSQSSVRKQAAQVLSRTVASTGLLESGSDLLVSLQRVVVEGSPAADGALLCLVFVAEDATALLESDLAGKPLATLVPFWISLLSHSSHLARERALKCLSCFTGHFPPALYAHAPEYLQALARLTHDPSPTIIKRVIRGFAALLEHRQDLVIPILQDVVEFCLNHIASTETGLGVASVEMFNVILIELADPAPIVGPVVVRLVPLLCARMEYTEDDIEQMWDEIQADSHIPDRDEDIKPRMAMLKGRLAGRDGDSEEDEDEANVAEANGRIWTVRESSGKCLENLSRKIAADMLLPVLIPCLEAGLTSPSWPKREASVMGLGAVAIGCEHALEAYLPALIPFLVSQASDDHVPLRKISLWTLGRFAQWVGTARPDLLTGIIEVVMVRVGDVNKGVQFAATSSFDSFVETAPPATMQPMLTPILNALCGSLAQAQANQRASTWDSLALCFIHLNVSQVGEQVAQVLWGHFCNTNSLDAWLPSACFALAKLIGAIDLSLVHALAPVVLERCILFCKEAIDIYDGAVFAGGDDEMFGEGDFDYVSWVLFLASAVLSRAQVKGLNGDALLDIVCQCGAALGDVEVLKQSLDVVGEVAGKQSGLLKWSSYVDFALRYAKADSEEGDVCRFALSTLSVLAAGEQGLSPEQASLAFSTVTAVFVAQEKGEVWSLGVDASLVAGLLAHRYPLLTAIPGECLRPWTRALMKLDESPDLVARAYAGWLRYVAEHTLPHGVECTALVVKAALQYRATSELESDLAAVVRALRDAGGTEFTKRLGYLSPDLQRAAMQRFGL